MNDTLPQPAYGPHTSLCGLKTSELLLVTTLRLWAAAYQDPAGGHADWRDGFGAAGLDQSGWSAFGRLMGIVAASPNRPLDIRCMCSHLLGRDEAFLLQAIGSIQRGHQQSAAAIFRDWLSPSGARLVMMPAHQVAIALAQVGLFIPSRCPTAPKLHAVAQSLHANPGLALIQ